MSKEEKKPGSGKRKFSDSDKKKILQAFSLHKGPKEAFFEAQGVTGSAVYRWKQEAQARKDSKVPGVGRSEAGGSASPSSQDRIAARKEAVEAYRKSGSTFKDFAKVWGVSHKSLARWCKVYEERGAKGLESGIYGEGKRGRKGSSPLVKAQIVAVQTEHPSFGLKKVRDFLFRFRGVKVSTGTVRKTVKEAELPRAPTRPKKKKRSSDKVRRFERARAMQLWQSDITSFVLSRHSQRVYLTVFMDDHSRYIVAWSLQLRQKADLVMDSLLLGIQRFGKPEEVLTDQGRQYFSWRGKSDFQKLLDKEGIRHVVARSHHPQTLGKCERFWETVGQEFWERVKPQELEDTRERLGHFIAHYNHFRPHQGIEGMTPADRFFGLSGPVRQAIEATLSQNELRLAVGDAPRSPVFLIGQIGDEPISLHGESGSLIVQTAQGSRQLLEYSSFGHAVEVKADLNATQPKGPSDAGITNPASVEPSRPAIPISERSAEPEGAPSQGESAEGPSSKETAGGDPHALGVGNNCREGTSPSNGSSPHGVLGGARDQAGDCLATGSAASSSVAVIPAGDLGYGGRAPSSPETPECPGVPGGRSEETEAQDRGTGEARSHAATPDCDSEGHADQPGSDGASGPGGEGNAARSDAASREGCKTSQEGQGTQEELESADDDMAGKRS